MEINKIYNGDCMTLMGDIDDGVIDLVVTDPPYLHDKSPIAPTTDASEGAPFYFGFNTNTK